MLKEKNIYQDKLSLDFLLNFFSLKGCSCCFLIFVLGGTSMLTTLVLFWIFLLVLDLEFWGADKNSIPYMGVVILASIPI